MKKKRNGFYNVPHSIYHSFITSIINYCHYSLLLLSCFFRLLKCDVFFVRVYLSPCEPSNSARLSFFFCSLVGWSVGSFIFRAHIPPYTFDVFFYYILFDVSIDVSVCVCACVFACNIFVPHCILCSCILIHLFFSRMFFFDVFVCNFICLLFVCMHHNIGYEMSDNRIGF